MQIISFVSIIFLTIAFPLTAIADGNKELSAFMYGDKWPLKVESGVIECLSNDAVVFKVGKSIYAINGVAKSYAKEYGYLSVSQIWKDDQTFYQMAKEIADTDPNVSIKDVLNKMGKIPKMNIDPILSSGIELCK